ncbi:hypothetical protein POM88_007348 [Heracleum sosnowskyi]|uniref:Piwi domain-containing protein n=1 Tax=Heracleum sosnowskyi TaxID=360622 RepID=A0AAD8N0U4_9APIA|nr:hypothetical protein POM88_007348 [Heracleum sosnowskyi]
MFLLVLLWTQRLCTLEIMIFTSGLGKCILKFDISMFNLLWGLCAQLVAKGQPVADKNAKKVLQGMCYEVAVGRKGASVMDVAAAQKKQSKVFTSILSARSKVACGLVNRPKDGLITNIDATDVDDELAAVEYVSDIYNQSEGTPLILRRYSPALANLNSIMSSRIASKPDPKMENMVFFLDELGSIKGLRKIIGELSCCSSRKINDQYLTNVLLKINSKLGDCCLQGRVSESQLSQVLNKELDQMIKAYQRVREENIPKFMLIVAQKNHHAKLFKAGGVRENVPLGQ